MPEPIERLLPLGPFPPWGPARQGSTLDLGALLRDQLLQRRALWGPFRHLLQSRLAQAIEAGAWSQAAETLHQWLHTWPVGAMVDPAVAEWCAQPSPESLAVLARASELACAALGWPLRPGTPWPAPTLEWVRAQVGAARPSLIGRGEGDQRGLIMQALGLSEPVEELPVGLPRVRSLPGEALAARRAELVSALLRGELGAVHLTSPLPPGPAAVLALAELRLEGDHQRAFEAWGPAGLRVRGFRLFGELLEPAPPGDPGPVLAPTGDCLLTPGTPAMLARGQPETVGWLVWEAPFRPVPVAPVAVEVLRALDGQRGVAELRDLLGLGEAELRAVLDALVQAGAATAA